MNDGHEVSGMWFDELIGNAAEILKPKECKICGTMAKPLLDEKGQLDGYGCECTLKMLRGEK